MYILLALIAALTTAEQPHPAQILWKGEQLNAGSSPEEWSVELKSVLETWSPWASEHHYRLEVSDDQRTVFVVAEADQSTREERRLITETCARFDRVLPAAPPCKESAAPAAPRLGLDDNPLDQETIVLVQIHHENDYPSLFTVLEQHHPYLASWVETGRRSAGFVLQRPLVGAWLESGMGLEEWNPQHELVHRLAQLLLARRYEQMPVWMQMGIAWQIEFDLLGSIYCYPDRGGFVARGEHTGFEKSLQRRFRGRDKEPLRMIELAAVQRGRYDSDSAAVAWGMANFLVRFHADALGPFAENLRKIRREKGKQIRADGTWVVQPEYEVSVDDQQASLVATCGEEVLEQASEFFRKGNRYKPARDVETPAR